MKTEDLEPAAFWVPTTKISPWDANPRENDHAVDDVAQAITRFGFASPIVARLANSEIINGHTRLKAAEQLGLERVPVRFVDVTQNDARLMALSDNKLGELARWSAGLPDVFKALEAEGEDLEGLGWSGDELAEILTPGPFELDGSEDEVPEIQEEVHSKAGEVYEMGPHRLICGDCTDPEVWDAVVGDERLRCVWTDPPYGVSYVGKTADALTIDNDAMTPEDTAALWSDAFAQLQRVSEPGAAWYSSGPQGMQGIGWQGCGVLDSFGMKRTLIWVKNSLVMGRSDYHYRHEPIYYGWFEGAARLHAVPSTSCSVFECPRPTASKEHPTMKPVELIRPMIENSSGPGWMVGDPFAGSGSTLIACAMTGRRARLIELDPRYCDVIRRRWTTWAKDHNQDPGPGALA